MACFEMVEQGLDRHPRAAEYLGAAHDFRVASDGWFGHGGQSMWQAIRFQRTSRGHRNALMGDEICMHWQRHLGAILVKEL